MTSYNDENYPDRGETKEPVPSCIDKQNPLVRPQEQNQATLPPAETSETLSEEPQQTDEQEMTTDGTQTVPAEPGENRVVILPKDDFQELMDKNRSPEPYKRQLDNKEREEAMRRLKEDMLSPEMREHLEHEVKRSVGNRGKEQFTLRHKLFACWYILLSGDATNAYKEAYRDEGHDTNQKRGALQFARPAVKREIERVRGSMVLVQPLDNLDEMSLDVLNQAYTLSKDPTLSAKERTEAVKTFATLVKQLQGVTKQGEQREAVEVEDFFKPPPSS